MTKKEKDAKALKESNDRLLRESTQLLIKKRDFASWKKLKKLLDKEEK